MHRSRVTAIVIDCQDLRGTAQFWAAALGTEVAPDNDSAPTYLTLQARLGTVTVLLQQVPESKACKSRVHLDIETDDIEAEVSRLEALGARRQEFVEGWWVMQDPAGNDFCVVPVQSQDFPGRAPVWEG